MGWNGGGMEPGDLQDSRRREQLGTACLPPQGLSACTVLQQPGYGAGRFLGQNPSGFHSCDVHAAKEPPTYTTNVSQQLSSSQDYPLCCYRSQGPQSPF